MQGTQSLVGRRLKLERGALTADERIAFFADAIRTEYIDVLPVTYAQEARRLVLQRNISPNGRVRS